MKSASTHSLTAALNMQKFYEVQLVPGNGKQSQGTHHGRSTFDSSESFLR